MKQIVTITDVAERQLCTGCGVCAYVQPGAIQMVDDVDRGRRPIVARSAQLPGGTDIALSVCPGIGLGHEELIDGAIRSLRGMWGPVLEVWEGYAGDPTVRFAASSGGVSSALAIHAIENQGMHGLLHIRARTDKPYLNETVMSTTRADILEAVGSRYSPASPCDGLELIENGPSPSVFIGKPCDVAGARKAAAANPALAANLGLTIAIFCAGTPTLRGTLEMLDAMGVDDLDAIESVRYRGNGWPGSATVTMRNDPDGDERVAMTYEESWGGILQRHRQWRCYVCADHTGEFADIAVGDPWYRPPDGIEPGRSLILVRTERGRLNLRRALDAGAIVAEPVPAHRVPDAQPWLGQVRGEVGARVATLRLLRIPAPKYYGMPMWPAWFRQLSWRDKVRSTVGTIRRVRRKELRRRHRVRPLDDDVLHVDQN